MIDLGDAVRDMAACTIARGAMWSGGVCDTPAFRDAYDHLGVIYERAKRRADELRAEMRGAA
jgi:hypothetical protein